MSTETAKAAAKRHYQLIKRRALERFSPPGKDGDPAPYCADCGEKDTDVLLLHHNKGDGLPDRKELGWGAHLYERVIARHYPPGVLVVLCYNCHIKRHRSTIS